MGLKFQHQQVLPDIELYIDENLTNEKVDKLTEEWGPNIPVLMINDYHIPIGNLLSMEIDVSINKLLTLELVVDDVNQIVQNMLKNNEYNLITTFIGNKDLHYKFQTVIKSTYTDVKNNNLIISSELWVKEFYDNQQLKFNDKSIDEILNNQLQELQIGYFTSDNVSLQNKISEIINPNKSNLQFITEIINKYTDNIWSIDQNIMFHIGNLEGFLKNNVSKFIFYENIKLNEKKDIILTNTMLKEQPENENDEKVNPDGLRFRFYSIDNKTTEILKQEYKVVSETDDEKIIFKNDLGIGNTTENTYSKFVDRYFPNYHKIIRKQLLGNVFTVAMSNVLLEIYPFQKVYLELYTKNEDDEITKKITEKLIVGYKFIYRRTKSDKPQLKQTIKLI